MKDGDMGIYNVPHERVETVDGLGTLVHYEVAYRYLMRLDDPLYRLGVVLDKNPYNYSPAYYHERYILRRNINE
jgi:hypothetical protein